MSNFQALDSGLKRLERIMVDKEQMKRLEDVVHKLEDGQSVKLVPSMNTISEATQAIKTGTSSTIEALQKDLESTKAQLDTVEIEKIKLECELKNRQEKLDDKDLFIEGLQRELEAVKAHKETLQISYADVKALSFRMAGVSYQTPEHRFPGRSSAIGRRGSLETE